MARKWFNGCESRSPAKKQVMSLENASIDTCNFSLRKNPGFRKSIFMNI